MQPLVLLIALFSSIIIASKILEDTSTLDYIILAFEILSIYLLHVLLTEIRTLRDTKLISLIELIDVSICFVLIVYIRYHEFLDDAIPYIYIMEFSTILLQYFTGYLKVVPHI